MTVGTLVYLGTKQNLDLNLSKRLIKVFESNQVTNDLVVVAINVRGHLFDLFLLRPINNLSVIKGQVFLGWTGTKLGLMFLLKDTTQWGWWGSNLQPFGLESSTLPLSHCAPYVRGQGDAISTTVFLSIHQKKNLTDFGQIIDKINTYMKLERSLVRNDLDRPQKETDRW